MTRSTGVQLGLDLGLPRIFAARLASLHTPPRIQDFVNAIPWNHEPDGPTARSVVETLRTYSVAIDLRRYDPATWATHPGFCHEMVDALTGSRHFPILPPGMKHALRPIDEIEARSNLLKDYP